MRTYVVVFAFTFIGACIQALDIPYEEKHIVTRLHKVTKKRRSIDKSAENEIEYLLVTQSRMFRMLLEKQRSLIAPDFFKKFNNGKNQSLKYHHDCYYQGVLKNGLGRVEVSLCNGVMNGMISDNLKNKTYFIEYKPESSQHILYKVNGNMEVPGLKYFNEMKITNASSTGGGKHRARRNVVDLSGVQKYLEFAVVVDNKTFVRMNRKTEDVLQYVISIVNHMDFVYRQVNIRIILTNLEIWQEKDMIEIDTNAGTTLGRFEAYVINDLIAQKNWTQDNAHLLTDVIFENSVAGYGAVGTLCLNAYSSAISRAWTTNPQVMANTVAHELGHNFGLPHYGVSCSCKNQPCVMSTYVSWSPVQGFTDCSVALFENRCKGGYCGCLTNIPPTFYVQEECGNGFLEAGEECDCGKVEYCTNPCCEASTCKLKGDAICAEGECCDIQKCQLKSKGTICRVKGSACDLPETCDGGNSSCPTDVHLQDFTPCEEGQSYCHAGACVPSLQNQCQILWGQNARHGKCYGRNQVGDTFGNCGKDDNGNYIACQANDEDCGKLQCYGNDLPTFILFGTGRRTRVYSSQGESCRTGVTNIGIDVADPTLALQGSQCGDGKVCERNKCKDVSIIHSKSSCLGKCGENGNCTNFDKCYCKPFFKCPDCVDQDLTNVFGKLCETSVPEIVVPKVSMECGDFERIGCRSGAGVLLANFRNTIQWSSFQSWFNMTICECAKLARDNNYAGFGIEFWGECRGYSTPHELSSNTNCYNTVFKNCEENDDFCVGAANVVFVYAL